MDSSAYRQAMARAEQHEDEAMLGGAAISDEEKYRDADRLKFPCRGCGKEMILDSVFTGAVSVDMYVYMHILQSLYDNFHSSAHP